MVQTTENWSKTGNTMTRILVKTERGKLPGMMDSCCQTATDMIRYRRQRQAMGFLLAVVLVWETPACLLAQSHAPDTGLLIRRTPIVEVCEASKDAVVNISSTQIIEVRSPFGLDSLFDNFFDFPSSRPRVKKYLSVGSGFLIHSAGYIVTNAHVVARTAEREVSFADQSKFDAQVVAIDHERDLAILKINAQGFESPLHPIKLGRSDNLMVGETVIAIGNPLNYGHTVTVGIISALNRRVEFDQNLVFEAVIQTDASINPGSSGGPLLNILGELVGINTAIRAGAENIGFAIPVDELRELLPAMLDVGRRYGIVTGLSVNVDAVVVAVEADSPADTAGCQPGDHITNINDQSISNAIDFHIALIGLKPGEKLAIQWTRGSEIFANRSITLAKRPKPDGAKLLKDRFGIDAEPLTDKMARALGLRLLQGLMVNRVEPNGPAQKARIERGDVVVQIGRHTTANLDDVGRLLDRVRPGTVQGITVFRITGRTIYRLMGTIEAR